MTPEYQLPVDEVVAALGSNRTRGLSESDARTRLAQHGPNELAAERSAPGWKKFLAQFRDTLVILLLAATGISFALWLYEEESALPYEALAISAVVLLNAVLGYVQEQRAASAIAALRHMSAAHAHVVRDGEARSIPAADLVPGDLLLIEEGDTVAADARVIESTALHMAEAPLTGESLPVSKDPDVIAEDVALGDRSNMIYSGTSVTYGHGTALVTATGMRTEMGRIAGMLSEVQSAPTPLQQELDSVGKRLGTIVVIIAVVMIATILALDPVRGLRAFFDVLILGVALAVAAVPEGLPAVVAAVLAIGVQRMARRNAIIRHLSAVETLGSASVIASDKTGTLTKNQMTVREVVTASAHVVVEGTGYGPEGNVRLTDGGGIDGAARFELERALAVADRANNAAVHQEHGQWVVVGDPTEGALRVAARKAGLEPESLKQRYSRIGEVPFSAERKLMTTVHADTESNGRVLVFTKGAPDILLTRCTHELVGRDHRPLTEEQRHRILEANDGLTAHALRTLGVAYRVSTESAIARENIDEHLERDLVFAGLIGMIDPPREEARAAVARALTAGVRPVMITGDHPRTAAVIARELGIGDGRAVTGAELERMDDRSLEEAVADVSVYARVNPEHKLRIVRALQKRKAIVAMTGDGVNDAPALKMANIGVAMGVTGTDVSKQAADMVLADDNFATIVAAIEEGRAIFSNIRKFLRYLLSSNIGEVLTMFFGVVFADTIGLKPNGDAILLPLVATQLLWINMVTDGAPALALGVDPADPTLMQHPPRPATERVITGHMWGGIVFVGLIMAAGTLYVLDADLPGGFFPGRATLAHGQTMAFTTLMLFQMFNLFNARSDSRSAFVGLFTNGWLWGAIFVSVALQVAVVYVPFLQRAFSTSPLSPSDWLTCAAVASTGLWLRELEKLIRRTAFGRQ